MVEVAAGQTSFGLSFAPAWVYGPCHPCTSSPAIPSASSSCHQLLALLALWLPFDVLKTFQSPHSVPLQKHWDRGNSRGNSISLFFLSSIASITRALASFWCSRNLSVAPLSASSKALRQGRLLLEAGWEETGLVCPDEDGVASSLWSTTDLYASIKGLGCELLGECALKKVRACMFTSYTAILRWWVWCCGGHGKWCEVRCVYNVPRSSGWPVPNNIIH